MTVPEKLRLARKLVELGVDILEAGFPIASEGDFEAVDAVSREFPGCKWPRWRGPTSWISSGRRNRSKHARRPRIHTFIATSDIHLKYKLKKSQQQVLDEAVAAVELARKYTDDVEFSAEDATRTDWDYLEQISRAVVAAGARTVNLPDTVGYSVPEEYGALIGRMVRALGDSAIVSVHCHDDLGLAVANSIAAVQAGARQIECTINGIGERAGNAALEEIVMAFKTRHDKLPFETKIVTEQIYAASQLLARDHHVRAAAEQSHRRRECVRARSGHPSGWILEGTTTYEIIDPQTVGVPESKLVLGKHSGRHALNKRAEDLGFELEPGGAGRGVPSLHGAGGSQEGRAQRRDRRAGARSGGRKKLPRRTIKRVTHVTRYAGVERSNRMQLKHIDSPR